MYRLTILAMIVILIVVGFGVPTPVKAAPNALNTSWYGEYFDNGALIGPPKVTRYDSSLNFNWGEGAPAAEIPADNFSARWGADPYFDAGTYRFTVLADDGVAVTIDFNNSVVNTLNDPKPNQTFTADVTLTAGTHHIQVDFIEYAGLAYIYVNWQRITPDPNPGPSGDTAYVTVNRLNFRDGPGTSFPILGVVTYGTSLRLVGRNNDATWVYVERPGGQRGWVSSRYINTAISLWSLPVITIDPGPEPHYDPIAYVAAGALHVRSGPSSSYNVVAYIYQGQTVYMLGRNLEATWIKIRLTNGQEGWVNASYIIPSVPVHSLPVVYGGGDPGGNLMAYVAVGALNVRSGPSVYFNIITVVYRGQVVSLLGRNADATWVKVVTPSGQQGWLNVRYVTPTGSVWSLPVLW